MSGNPGDIFAKPGEALLSRPSVLRLARVFLYDFFTDCLLHFYGEAYLIDLGGQWCLSAVVCTGKVWLGQSPVRLGVRVLDVIFVVAAIVFFGLSLGYVKFCDRIR